jgi:hypothetical protein
MEVKEWLACWGWRISPSLYHNPRPTLEIVKNTSQTEKGANPLKKPVDSLKKLSMESRSSHTLSKKKETSLNATTKSSDPTYHPFRMSTRSMRTSSRICSRKFKICKVLTQTGLWFLALAKLRVRMDWLIYAIKSMKPKRDRRVEVTIEASWRRRRTILRTDRTSYEPGK